MPFALPLLNADGRLLFATRFVRLFAYGALSVVLVLYLVSIGLTAAATGFLLTAILLGDTVVSLLLTTQADRLGRRRTLVIGALLMAAAGVTFAYALRCRPIARANNFAGRPAGGLAIVENSHCVFHRSIPACRVRFHR